MSFYEEMQQAAAELLASTDDGGLGQGDIRLVRTVLESAEEEWEEPSVTTASYFLNGAVSGVNKELIGTEMGGTVIVGSDLSVITTPPPTEYQPGDFLRLDGEDFNIISFKKIPAVGVTVATRFIVRG